MREILFRAKDAHTIDHEWLYGYVCAAPWEPEGIIIICVIEDDSAGGEAVIPETVGQFTGLTDKNGKQIFEGDIGRYKQTDGAKRNGNPIICVGKVVYNTKNASYAVESKDETGCKYFDYFPIRDFEVIGNIHDNPELLEVE